MRRLDGPVWRTVLGNPRYEVSSDGRVRNTRTRRELKWHRHEGGYHYFTLYTGTTYERRGVHRLMALAFLGPQPPERPLVRHLDDDPDHNVVENLAWGTKSENARDAIAAGRWFGAEITHCPNNHEYTPENTYSSPSNPGRRCRTCRRERAIPQP